MRTAGGDEQGQGQGGDGGRVGHQQALQRAQQAQALRRRQQLQALQLRAATTTDDARPALALCTTLHSTVHYHGDQA